MKVVLRTCIYSKYSIRRKTGVKTYHAMAIAIVVILNFVISTIEPSSENYRMAGKRHTTGSPLKSLIAGEWLFDGNAKDSSGNGNDGFVFKAQLISDRFGKEKSAYYFIEKRSYIEVLRTVNDDFSICAWIKTLGAGFGLRHYQTMPIVSSEWNDITNDFGIGVDSRGACSFGNGDGKTDYTVASRSKVNTGEWTFVAATRSSDTGAIKVYVNGKLEASGAGAKGSLDANPKIKFGSTDDSPFAFFEGAIDDIRIYSGILTDADVSDLFREEGTQAAKVISVTASSFIDYQSMYNPYRAFDSNPATAWLEKAKGAGIGETITLTLDTEITVDEIRFMPGYFDNQWWATNNRIRTLAAEAAGKIFTFDFIDVMKEQSKKLPAPLTFAKIRFTIKDVFNSNGDDDTALSEIAFYKGGRLIKLDASGAH
jgi:hypothetical protein